MTALENRLEFTDFSFGERYQGKVRDCYSRDQQLILITTDRLSAFDRVICTVPYKGQVLNLLTNWWYQKTAHIIANAKLFLPHPNVMIAKKCRVFPVEFVMRAYMTGSTDTSLWSLYQKGARQFDGCLLPEKLQKNSMLPRPLLTPTTKSDSHDEPITLNEIIEKQLMTRDELHFVSEKARALFDFGSAYAREKGLILVDTKYEFGVDEHNNIVIVDEVHTPDSSRYWLQSTYDQRLQNSLEPESFDKEILRIWLKNHANPYVDAVLPAIPNDLLMQLSARYVELYEKITETTFPITEDNKSLTDSIDASVISYLR